MRALVIGASGVVGAAFLGVLGDDATGTYRTRPAAGLRQLDANDAPRVRALIEETQPDAVFLTAAEANVEWCEEHPGEARERNLAPLRATLDAARGVPVVTFSTEYVFDGAAGPYREQDAVRPISEYGRIKLEVERIALAGGATVVRTTTVYGDEAEPAKNFALRLIASLRRGERVRVPTDQISTPTYAPDLAAASARVTARGGVWHIAGPELMSRDVFARAIARAFALDEALIEAVPTSALGQRAPRPLRAGLVCERYEREHGAAARRVADALNDLGLRRGEDPRPLP